MKSIVSSVILSRTDSIGDMVLTLPMAKILKDNFKNIKVYFLGSAYTRAIVESCSYSDGFIDVNDFLNGDITINNHLPDAIIHVKPERKITQRAKLLNIPFRIGTTNRLYNWTTCNKLVPLSRRRSNLHEAQLNLKLLTALKIYKNFTYKDITCAYGLNNFKPLEKEFLALVDKNKYNLILHPKSRGNAREWPIEHYINLIRKLDTSHYQIFISGTESERPFLQTLLNKVGDRVIDLHGKIPLDQFISFIAACDGLVACSTGPLHIAAAVGIDTFGIFVPIKPLYAGRWGPVGRNAQVFSLEKNCNDCKNNSKPCVCINNVLPETIFNAIEKQTAFAICECILLYGSSTFLQIHIPDLPAYKMQFQISIHFLR